MNNFRFGPATDNNMKTSVQKIICIGLSITMLSGCATVKKVKNKASSLGTTVYSWATNINSNDFKNGWNTAVSFASDKYAVVAGNDYVHQVQTAITDLGKSMQKHYGSARSVAQEAGFAAEDWIAGTFNIDAAAKQTDETASVPASNEQGSPDVTTSWGEQAQVKYYSTSETGAAAQAQSILDAYNKYAGKSKNPKTLREWLDSNGYNDKTMSDLMEAVYQGQTRIIPADQLDNAKAFLEGRMSAMETSEAMKRKYSSERVDSYMETLNSLSDRLKSPKGAESKPATYEEMQSVAELAMKDPNFDPSKFGFTLTQIITPDLIVKQAINTGKQTAMWSAALTIGPELFLCFLNAAKEGKIDSKELKKVGVDGILSGTGGFVNGTVSKALATACRAGYFGKPLMSVSPDVLATFTFVAIASIRYGYALAKGKITPEEYGGLMAEQVVVALGGIAGASLISTICPGIGILCTAGSIAAGILASAGLNKFENIVLKPQDGGNFLAMAKNNVSDNVKTVTDALANLNFSKKIDGTKQIAIKTSKKGEIVVDED